LLSRAMSRLNGGPSHLRNPLPPTRRMARRQAYTWSKVKRCFAAGVHSPERDAECQLTIQVSKHFYIFLRSDSHLATRSARITDKCVIVAAQASALSDRQISRAKLVLFPAGQHSGNGNHNGNPRRRDFNVRRGRAHGEAAVDIRAWIEVSSTT